MDKGKVVREAEGFMRSNVPKSRLPEEDYFHHVDGVRKYALHLAKVYNADEFVVEVAALLHDVAADAHKTHAAEGARASWEFLSKFDVPEEVREKIAKAIETHSIGSEAETMEQRIMQDADGISFIENNYELFFETQKQQFSIEEARKRSIEKTKSMMEKIKTPEGIKLAKKLMPKALRYLSSAH